MLYIKTFLSARKALRGLAGLGMVSVSLLALMCAASAAPNLPTDDSAIGVASVKYVNRNLNDKAELEEAGADGKVATVDAAGQYARSDTALTDLVTQDDLDDALDGVEYELPAATSTALGGVKLGSDVVQTIAANAASATASRTYGVQTNAGGQMVVNVPWTAATATTEGTGNAVTAVTATDGVLTVTKGATFVTSADVSGKEDKSNKITNFPEDDSENPGVSTHDQYPSAKLVYDTINMILSGLGNLPELFEVKMNKTTAWTQESAASDTMYPSAKLVFDTLQSFIGNFEEKSNKATEWTEEAQTSDTLYPTTKMVWSVISFIQSAVENLIAPATSTTYGMVKLGSDTVQTASRAALAAVDGRTYAVQTDSNGQMVVNVPWPTNGASYDLMTQTAITAATETAARTISAKLLGDNFEKLSNKSNSIASDTGSTTKYPTVKAVEAAINNVAVDHATSAEYGTVKLGSDAVQSAALAAIGSTAGRTYLVQNNASGHMVVNVPWVEGSGGGTAYTLPVMTTAVRGGAKIGSDTVQAIAANAASAMAGRTYAVQKNSSEQLVVNVPWADNNTTAITKAADGSAATLGVLTSDSGDITAMKYKTITAGNNITITPTASAITISAAAGGGSVDPATSTVYGTVKLASDTEQQMTMNPITSASGRVYGVQKNPSGQLVVNVPWPAAPEPSKQVFSYSATSPSTVNTTNSDTYMNHTVFNSAAGTSSVVSSNKITGTGTVTVSASGGNLTIHGTGGAPTSMTQAEINTGTDDTNVRGVTPKRVADNVNSIPTAQPGGTAPTGRAWIWVD